MLHCFLDTGLIFFLSLLAGGFFAKELFAYEQDNSSYR